MWVGLWVELINFAKEGRNTRMYARRDLTCPCLQIVYTNSSTVVPVFVFRYRRHTGVTRLTCTYLTCAEKEELRGPVRHVVKNVGCWTLDAKLRRNYVEMG